MWSWGFINSKGGCSKTSTVVNLSACLGKKGYRTVVVDADPQFNGGFVLLGGEPAREPTLTEVLLGTATAAESVVPTRFEGVDLLPSNATLADATAELMGEMGRERRLRLALETLADDYQFALIDSAPTRSILTVNVLNAVDEVIVPFSPGLFSAIGLGQLQDDVAQVRRFLDNKRLRIGGIVLAMTEKNNVHADLESQLREAHGDLILDTKIPRSIKIEEAHARFESVITYAPKSVGALAYTALAEELLAHAASRTEDRDAAAQGDPRAHGAA